MGSYARLRFRNGGLQEIKISDIYYPDGQLSGYVKPPLALAQAFDHGSWMLRDSNWDVDFTVAGPQIAWFFRQGGQSVDGIAAINLTLVQKLLAVLGPIELPEYQQTVSQKNFWGLAQSHAELNFVPGSTNKQDFLSSVGAKMAGELKELKYPKLLKILKVLYEDLRTKQIMLWAKDPEVQKHLAQKYWDGSLGEYINGYLYIVESNLGANKANCCVERQLTQEVTGDSHRRQEKVTIKYKNNNEFTNPKPPVFWGGDYINYLRVIIPVTSEIKSVTVNNQTLQIPNLKSQISNEYGIQDDLVDIEEREKFKIVGFWVKTPAQKNTIVEIFYELPTMNNGYSVLVKRQPGIESLPYRLIYNGKIIADEVLFTDKKFVVQ